MTVGEVQIKGVLGGKKKANGRKGFSQKK